MLRPSRWLQILRDFFYPPTCLQCGTLLGPPERHLCAECWSSIPSLNGRHPLFVRMKKRTVAAGTCGGLVSLFVFEEEGPFQALAHALKYSGFESIGTMLGEALGQEVLRRGLRADIVIPVPLHRAKRRERGFNQAEIIARSVSDVVGIPLETGALLRIRNTKSQTKLDRAERARNVQGAFCVVKGGEHSLTGRSCLLVDDVITTGATILSAASELRSSGVKNVIAASAALAE